MGYTKLAVAFSHPVETAKWCVQQGLLYLLPKCKLATSGFVTP